MNKTNVEIAVVVGAAAFVIFVVPRILKAVVPQVVQDGAEASGVLLSNTAHMISDPLDAFGISPAMDPGTNNPIWTATVPWDNPDDPLAGTDNTPSYLYF